MVVEDVQTTTGQNARLETGLDQTRASASIKQALEGSIPPVAERNKVVLPRFHAADQDRGEVHYPGKNTALLTSLINSLCSS